MQQFVIAKAAGHGQPGWKLTRNLGQRTLYLRTVELIDRAGLSAWSTPILWDSGKEAAETETLWS
jgi:hypothetical protein